MGAAIAACSPKLKAKYDAENYNVSKYALRFPKLKVSRNRIIKETVGLRPFRNTGPRIELQELGSKKIIHNYGHGGSGWSLSWGTAMQAAELADTTGEKVAAVMGCGVVGLSTARTLQKKGYQVSIYTKDTHPFVTSSMATGNWSPTSRVCDISRVTPEIQANIKRALLYSFKTFQSYLGVNDVVGWMDSYRIKTKENPASDHERELKNKIISQAEDPYPKAVQLTRAQHPFAYEDVTRTSTNIFNIPSYLKLQLDDFIAFGGKVYIREFKKPEDLDVLPEKLIMNCTGLGSMELFNDAEMKPISGQLAFLVPQPELQYRVGIDDVYFIPRKDGIMLGGNALDGNWNTIPDPLVTDYFIERLREVMEGMRA